VLSAESVEKADWQHFLFEQGEYTQVQFPFKFELAYLI
jgi:hypothetical protein